MAFERTSKKLTRNRRETTATRDDPVRFRPKELERRTNFEIRPEFFPDLQKPVAAIIVPRAGKIFLASPRYDGM